MKQKKNRDPRALARAKHSENQGSKWCLVRRWSFPRGLAGFSRRDASVRVTPRQCTRESARRWGASVAVTMPQPAPTRGCTMGVVRLVVVVRVITRRDLAARCTIFRGLLGVCNPGGTALRPAMGPHDGAGSPTDAVAAVRAQPRTASKFATCNRSSDLATRSSRGTGCQKVVSRAPLVKPRIPT